MRTSGKWCLLLAGALLYPRISSAQSSAAPAASSGANTIAAVPDSESDYDSFLVSAKKETARFYQVWLAAKTPAQKEDAANALIEAAVRSGDHDDVAQVARGGPDRRKLLLLPEKVEQIRLKVIFTLPSVVKADDNASSYEHAVSPIIRRLTHARFEAWAPSDGWLFDGHGRLLRHVSAPRRDGDGGPWFGAFLPSGRWITTDLWQDDRQLNCFSPQGKWLWELPGEKIYVRAPETEPPPGLPVDEPERQPIHWARSDRSGKGWVVSVGADDDVSAWVSPDGTSRLVPKNNPWSLTYPRAMQAKGTYLELRIPSDDGQAILTQNSAAHGDWIGFPTYRVESWTNNKIIPDGDAYFGFWPGSDSVWVETCPALSDGDRTNATLWLLDERGSYQAEIACSWLGDAADGKSLVLEDENHGVVTLRPNLQSSVRLFYLHPGLIAEPIAIYDDLRLGFFKDEHTHCIALCHW